MKCVTYSSFATAGLQPIDLETILATSRQHNARDGLTGVLMFNGAIFVQAIEGAAADVDGVMARIAGDLRHTEIEVRDERTIPQRIFPDWSMGYVRLDGGWLEGQFDVIEAMSREMPKRVRDILNALATTLPFG